MMDVRRGFTLIELMIVVAILSVLATVAIPSFIKYMNRARTTEAIDQLEKMHYGSVTYYARGQVIGGSGTATPCQFPATIGMTPDVTGQKCCKNGANDTDGDSRCDVDQMLWTNSTWSALSFEMRDQHYFGYSYSSSGTLIDAVFVARANADLDCDGVMSTFERYGFGNPSATSFECSARAGAAMYFLNEVE